MEIAKEKSFELIEVKDIQKYLSLKQESREVQKFSYRAMKELKALRQTPVCTKAYIKLKFPDMYVLQAAFSPSESAEFIYAFVRDVKYCIMCSI